MATKYKLTIKEITTKGGIAKLDRDGFTRQDISRTLYNETQGISQRERSNIMKQLHNRREPC